ncbi:MAG: phasin family protein [Gammaproteobacteria bacterium]
MLDTMTRQFEGALKQGRDMTLGFAKQVERAKGPVGSLEKRGLAVNEVAHRYLERAIRQQFDLIEAAIEESSKRLRAVAEADSLAELWQTQFEMNRKAVERLTKGLRETGSVVTAAREDLEAAIRPKPAAASKASKKKAPARKKAKTRTAKKATAKKATAKKATTKRKVSKRKTAKRAA